MNDLIRPDSYFYNALDEWVEEEKKILIQILYYTSSLLRDRESASSSLQTWEGLYRTLKLEMGTPPPPGFQPNYEADFLRQILKKDGGGDDDSQAKRLERCNYVLPLGANIVEKELSKWMVQCCLRYDTLEKSVKKIRKDYISYHENKATLGILGWFGHCWTGFLAEITGETRWKTISPTDFDAILVALRQIIRSRNGPRFFYV